MIVQLLCLVCVGSSFFRNLSMPLLLFWFWLGCGVG